MITEIKERSHAGKPHEWSGRRGWPRVFILGAMVFSMMAAAGSCDVFLLPTSNLLWRTVPSADFEVPVLMPTGASSATLVVSGHGYRREYAGLSDGMFPLSLPAVDSPDGENVYDLTLTFNDEAATARSAKIGVVFGMSPGESAVANVRNVNSGKWQNVPTKAVLPIPSGVDALSINGTPVDAGLYETPGWFLFLSQVGTTYDILLSEDGMPLAGATLRSISTGFKFILK